MSFCGRWRNGEVLTLAKLIQLHFNKNLLPYGVLCSNVLDDVFLGFVLLSIHPFIAMPVWYASAAAIGTIAYFITKSEKARLKTLLCYWPYTLGFLLFSMLSGFCWFLSVHYLGISGNTVIDQSHYLILILWSLLVFKESISKHQWYGASIIFTGLLIFALGSENVGDWLGIFFASLMAIGVAGAIISKKYAAGKINHNVLVTLRAWLMFAVTLIISLKFNNKGIAAYDLAYTIWIALIIGGAIGAGLSHHLSLAALNHVTLSTYTFVQMLHPLAILTIGVLFYGDDLSNLQLLAASFVLVGKLTLITGKKQQASKASVL